MKRITVKYPNGFEAEYNEDVANILIKRGSVELVKKSPGWNKKAKKEEDESGSGEDNKGKGADPAKKE
jgi:hypothetical protein